MTHTQSRTIQWLGIILVAVTIALGYWYFSVRAGVRTGTSLALPAGAGRLDSGLAAYYALDAASGSSATDSSTNANTGTLTNMETPTDWVAAQVGNGLDFDGVDEYVTVADTASQDYGDTESFTITGWFNRDTFTTDDTIIAKRNGITAGDTGYLCYLDDATDQLICEISDGTDEYSVTSTSTFTATGWNHFAFVWDQTSATATDLYINGVSNNATDSGTIGNIGDLGNAVAFRLGAESDAGNPYDGKLDEMRVYNRPLTSDEIGQLYRLTAPTGVDTGLKGYWSFDGMGIATSTLARDLSGARNTGTLTGGPTRAAGRAGQGLSLDGTDDYVSIADNSNLDFNNADFTLSGWFARSSATSDDTLIAKRNGIANTDDGYICYVDDATDRLTCEMSDNADTDEFQLEANITITDTNWHYFTLVWDDDSAANTEIYIDGAATNATETGTLASIGDLSNAVVFSIGAESDAGNPFIGRMDEVRVYNRTLSSTEVQALYRLSDRDEVSTSASQPQGGGRLDSGVIAYWPLDETTGATATDASNGGNNVTLTNMENGDWVTGQIGNGLDFDGVNEYGTSSRTVPDRGSMSVWVKSGASLDTGAYWVALFGGDGSNYISLYADTFSINNSYCFAMRGNFGTSVGGCGLKFASTATFQEWHHLTATWDATKGATLYMDGAPVYTTTTGTSAFVSMTLGLTINDATQNWLGRLDEVRMYNRILSADEVNQLYRLTSPTAIETSLKGYWAFSGQDVSSTSVFDMSGTGNNGTLTGGPTAFAGVVGQGYNFDGTDDYLSVTDASTLDFNNADFTLSGWFRRDTFTTDDTVVAKRNGLANTDDGYLCYIDDATDRLTCEMSEAAGTDEFQLETSQTFTDTDWHYFALVWDDDSATGTDIYVDGVATSATETGTIGNIGDLSNGVTLRLGAESDAGNPFDGKLDEFRVYNRVLTAAEVKSQYEAAAVDLRNSSAAQPQGSGRLDGGLVAYWKLDETTGSSASDSSTSGNAGTLTNMENGDWAAAQIGNGLTFDGVNEYITVTDADNLDFDYNQDFSLSLWAKLPATQTDTGDIDNALIEKWSNNGDPSPYYLDIFNQTDGGGNSGRLSFKRYDNTNEPEVISVRTVNSDTWRHIVALKRGASLRVYIDGSLDATGTDTTTATTTNSTTICIARRCPPTNDLMLQGSLDEIRIYNRALSDNEVTQLYRLGTTTTPDTGLKGYWSFNGPDMVSSTIARDLSGAGNNGTLTNTPTKTFGKLGQALNFASASSQYVNVGSAATIDDLTSKSICAWVMPNSSLTVGGSVMGKFSLTPGGWEFVIDYVTLTSLRLAWYQTFNGADGYWLTTTALPYNKWSHVCVTYNNSSTTNDPTLYVNGVAASITENTTPTGTADSDGNGSAYIGVADSSLADKFDGKIDEVRLYNRILTAAEVKMLYDASR